MKYVVAILAIVFAIIIALLIFRRRDDNEWRPKTQLTFLGFVNTNAGSPPTNALFGMTEVRREETWWDVVEISHKDGVTWNSWEPLPKKKLNWYRAHPTNFHSALTVPVMTTNAPVRIVFELRKGPGGPIERFFRDSLNRCAQLVGSRRWWPSIRPGQTFLITNEVYPATAAGSTNAWRIDG